MTTVTIDTGSGPRVYEYADAVVTFTITIPGHPFDDIYRRVHEALAEHAVAVERQAERARATRPRPADYRPPRARPAPAVPPWTTSRRAFARR